MNSKTLGWQQVANYMPTSPQILVVEDNMGLRKALDLALTEMGYQVRLAASSEEADSWLSAMHFDIMLLDIGLPRMNGVEFLEWALKSNPELAVVMLTGIDDMETVTKCLESGARTYLVKPLHPDLLRLILKDALAVRSILVERNQLMNLSGAVEVAEDAYVARRA